MLHLTVKQKRLVWGAIIFAIALAAMAGIVIPALASSDPTIVFLQATHIGNEPGYDHVRWDYSVTAGKNEDEGDEAHDVSYAIVAVPSCYEVIDAAPEPVELGFDKKTGIDGVKWEAPLKVGQTATYWFVTRIADGQTKHDDVAAAIKASGDIFHFTVDGPTCEPTKINLVSVNVTNNTLDYALFILAVILFVGGAILYAYIRFNR